jgi:hypothetical protein
LSAPGLPQPAGAAASPWQFSANRAYVHVATLAGSPRPVASSMNTQARAYILATLRGMGLKPEVQTATVHRQSIDAGHNVHVTLAVVHNIVVLKPGNAPGHESRPAPLLATHYDSAPDTLGAADGAASAAAMLETLRALQAGPPLADDAVFLFADADKIGALGEQAFVEQHPLAKRIGAVLSFRNLGNQGPLYLYDTAGPAGEAIRRWASAAPDARGSSFLRDVHRSAGQVGPLAALNAPVLAFATVAGRLGIYDTPARLALPSLQHEGDTMLALAREFARQPAPGPDAQQDVVYFTLPALGVITYPGWLVWPTTVLACLLLASVCRGAVRRGEADLIGLVKGTYGFALISAAPMAALFLAGRQAPVFELARDPLSGLPDMRVLAIGAAAVAALSIVLQRWLRNTCGACAAGLGALLWIAVLLVLATVAMPGASFVLAWPLFAAAAALADLQSRRVAALPRPLGLALLLAGFAPALLLIGPALRDAVAVPAPPRLLLDVELLALLLGLGSMLIASLAKRFAVRSLVLAGLGLLALPGTAGAPAQAPLKPNPLVYYKDMPTWSEWWLARDAVLDDWPRALFAAQPRPRRLVDVFGWDSDDLWYARATRSEQVSFPYAIQLANDAPPNRRIEFDLTSKNRAPNIELSLWGGKPWRASVNGREITNDGQVRNWSLSIYGMEDNRLHFDMDLVGDPYLIVHVEERMPGVPGQALPSRIPGGVFMPGTGQTVAADNLYFR